MRLTGGWEGPYPDENAYSIISRLAVYVITPSHYLTVIRMFGKNRSLGQYVLKPLKKSDLAGWGIDVGGSSYKDHVLHHSCYPIYGTMLCRSRLEGLSEIIGGAELQDGRDKYLTRALGCTWMRKHTLYYCPACAAAELERYGEPYWHRMHQIPGIDVCLEHRLMLCDSGLTFRDINHRFIPLYYIVATVGFGSEEVVENSLLIELAEDIIWLDEHGLDLGGRENIETLIDYQLHAKSLDPGKVHERGMKMYEETVRKYLAEGASQQKWKTMASKTYLYTIMLVRATGMRIRDL